MKRTLAAVAVILPSSLVQAQLSRFNVTRLAHSTDPLPGSPVFSGFYTAVVDQGLVAFTTLDADGRSAVYASNGGVTSLVADRNTLIPGTSTPFGTIRQPFVSSGRIIFPGDSRPDITHRGVYNWSGGGLGTVDTIDTWEVSVHNETIAAQSFNADALFLGTQAGLTMFADSSTPAPGSAGTFQFFYELTARNETVAFIANDSEPGIQRRIYQYTPAGFELVADENTPVPGRSATFSSFDNVLITEDLLAFRGRWSGGLPNSGIFAGVGEEFFRIVDEGMFVPGTSRRIFSPAFGGMAAWRDDILFTAGSGSGSSGYDDLLLSLDLGEELLRVASSGDMLDGRIIDGMRVIEGGISGDTFVFVARFTDGTSGVYAAMVPAPPGALLAMGLAVSLVRRRRCPCCRSRCLTGGITPDFMGATERGS